MKSLTPLLMPVLTSVSKGFGRDRPFVGWTVLLHLHLTRETVTLGCSLREGGARVVYFPSNRQPSDPVIVQEAGETGPVLAEAAELARDDFPFKRASPPYLIVEGSGQMFRRVHQDPPRPAFFDQVVGISMHTSGGGRFVDALNRADVRVPVVAIYRDRLKTELETGHGTSQSVVAALLRGLGCPVAGRRAAVVGFGNVGRGIARSLRTLGCRVIVVEKAAEARLFARLEGFALAELTQALREVDLCVTTTGEAGIVDAAVLAQARPDVVLANVSDQPCEIDLRGCSCLDDRQSSLSKWKVKGGPQFFLLGKGIQVNHIMEQGNPAELMDLSFSLHALSLRWLVDHRPPAGIYPVPEQFRQQVATVFLEARQ